MSVFYAFLAYLRGYSNDSGHPKCVQHPAKALRLPSRSPQRHPGRCPRGRAAPSPFCPNGDFPRTCFEVIFTAFDVIFSAFYEFLAPLRSYSNDSGHPKCAYHPLKALRLPSSSPQRRPGRCPRGPAPPARRSPFCSSGRKFAIWGKCRVRPWGAWARWRGRCGGPRMRLGRCPEGSMARLAAEYGPQTRRRHAPTAPSKIRIFLTGHAVLPLLRGAGERFWKGRPEGRIKGFSIENMC